ncbi:cytochrome b [Salipiger mangrovisoli]|uniref:Cytochrome b/b6 domain-containing protein n=1 Tax=Salipiger mangrovisoli TaxID=2865933 RepID=A0ABR9XB08_9RHOB|nr:cytochrome b/b6 domain-containing protein [Salipiger mangrovisoli]MBE9640677.1 cytochrome b/b6 domain-containing protein [Salipiger mangrovisoli]
MPNPETAEPQAPEQYSRAQKRLHWAIVVLIAVQYLAFDHMGRAFRAVLQGTEGAYDTTSVAHLSIGVAVLVLMLWRLVLRLRRGTPPLPEAEPDWARKLSGVVHWLFYGLLIGLPLIGLLAWFGKLGVAGEAHEIATTILLWVIGLHLAGVAVHQLWWRSGLLRRMT